ncbi:MAG: Asp-tRNA(Asn)/Glu-tRNA(Gln) amidotransferase subunit GatB [Firmicutes bacterium]|nr:Asp-tRNA(Asn)/Glu-tRNA(Gln) amidotransferase subunit GatB [Candidatus Fermentithermobacillaceae bacterium]
MAREDLELVVGLEVHAELLTRSKMFCRCSTRFGDPPNTNVCPVCLGLPGALPVVNREAVRLAVIAALALNCRVNLRSRFARKNYFYPDLPKGYQISQYDEPLAVNGCVMIPGPPPKKIRIRRLHLEEDAGKSIHEGDDVTRAAYSLLDFNRCGAPLIEIVSEPDISSPEEARQYLEELRRILEFTGVSDVKMEEGSMRVDSNVSLRRLGQEQPGALVEVKNLNSFRAVVRALAYEKDRQSRILTAGGTVRRETRGWDESLEITVPLRLKETSEDYRYFPDPDLPPLILSEEWLESVKREMPPLPEEKKRYYVDVLGIPAYDASILTSSRKLSRFFDECVSRGADPKAISNWILSELLGYMNSRGLGPDAIPTSPEFLVKLIRLIDIGVISGRIAKDILVKMCETGRDPEEIVREEGLQQVTDRAFLEHVVDEVIAENLSAVEAIKKGRSKAMGFLVGQVMKKTGGKANPELVNIIIKSKLE